MTKIIGIKDLQKNTKYIRKEVENGVSFLVIYRSKPVFEIRPLSKKMEFVKNLEATGLYNDDFIKRMEDAETEINKGKLKSFSPEDFLKSI